MGQMDIYLTLSSPVVSNSYISNCSGPYWSNQPFLIFLTFGHSGAQDWAPECPNVRKLECGLDQYGAEGSGRPISATIRKSVRLKGLNMVTQQARTLATGQRREVLISAVQCPAVSRESFKMDLLPWCSVKLSSLTNNWASSSNTDLSRELRPSSGETSSPPGTAQFLRTLPRRSVVPLGGCRSGEPNRIRFDVSLTDDCATLSAWCDVIVGVDSIVSRSRPTSSWWYVVLAARAECQLASDWAFPLVDRLSVDNSRCPLSGEMSCSMSAWLDIVLSILGDNRSVAGQTYINYMR